MSFFTRKEIPMYLLSITGIMVIVAYYFQIPALTSGVESLRSWVAIIGIFTVFLGTISLTWREYQTATKRGLAWQSSVWYIIIFLGTILMYIIAGGSEGASYNTWFTTLFEPLDAAIWSTLALMIFGALFKVFRIRSWESALLVVSMILVLLTNATVGEAIWPGFPEIGNWLLTVPSFGSSRADSLVATLASIVLGVRILIGYEKRAM